MRRFVHATVLTWLCACTVGAPIVDDHLEVDGPDNVGPIGCALPPPCEEIRGLPPMAAYAAEPIPLQACGIEPNCSVAESPETTVYCEGAETGPVLPQTASCHAFVWRPSAELDALTLEDVDWSELDLTIEVTRPTLLTLRAPKLRSVFVQLAGPITLRLERAYEAQDLRFTGITNDQGAPRIEFERAAIERLRVGTSESRFEGALSLVAAIARDVGIHTLSLTTESGQLLTGTVQTGTIQLIDQELDKLTLEAGGGLLSAFAIRESRLRFCGDVTLVEGRILATAVASCEDAVVRLYQTNVGSSSLDGLIETDAVSVAFTVVGALQPTQLHMYSSTLGAMLCEQLEEVALAYSRIACSECADPDAALETLCHDAERVDTVGGNFCPSLTPEVELPICDDELLLRRRPGRTL